MPDVRGLPFGEYDRQTPLGWRPYMRDYPLSLYDEEIRLWLRMTDVLGDCQGSIMVGRLKGAAYCIAIHICLVRHVGTVKVGDESVNLPRELAMIGASLESTP